MRTRLTYLLLAVGTIALGLAVHRGDTLLTPLARDFLGDALWAMMIAWWIGVAAPHAPPRWRALVALAICWAVEFSQLYHSPMMDGVRRTTPGHLLLGSDFDLRDLAAYALGISCGMVLEVLARRTVAIHSKAAHRDDG